jgi:hypothetical protein
MIYYSFGLVPGGMFRIAATRLSSRRSLRHPGFFPVVKSDSREKAVNILDGITKLHDWQWSEFKSQKLKVES